FNDAAVLAGCEVWPRCWLHLARLSSALILQFGPLATGRHRLDIISSPTRCSGREDQPDRHVACRAINGQGLDRRNEPGVDGRNNRRATKPASAKRLPSMGLTASDSARRAGVRRLMLRPRRLQSAPRQRWKIPAWILRKVELADDEGAHVALDPCAGALV